LRWRYGCSRKTAKYNPLPSEMLNEDAFKDYVCAILQDVIVKWEGWFAWVTDGVYILEVTQIWIVSRTCS